MKNQDQKIQKKNVDKVNIQNVKVNVSKMDQKDFVERSLGTNKRLYKNQLSKSERGKLRNQSLRFANNILALDRSEDQKAESIKDFLKFYSDNWLIVDFKMENFSSRKKPTNSEIQEYLEKEKKEHPYILLEKMLRNVEKSIS